MSSVRRSSLFALVFTLSMSACKESTMGPGEPLDLVETEALFAGIGARMVDSTSIISSSEERSVAECPVGGLMTVDAEVRNEMKGDTLHLETDFMVVPEMCGFPSRNLDFTITGNIGFAFALWFVDLFPVNVEASITGSVDWQLEDRWGTCGIDLALRQDNGGRYGGTMCGLDVDFEFESFIPTGSGGARWSLLGSSAASTLHPPVT